MASLISDVRALVIGTRKVLIKDGSAQIDFGGFTNTPVLAGQEVVGATRQGVAASIAGTTGDGPLADWLDANGHKVAAQAVRGYVLEWQPVEQPT